MVLLTLVGSFMALTGIILHSISRIIHECKSEMVTMDGERPLSSHTKAAKVEEKADHAMPNARADFSGRRAAFPSRSTI